MRFRVSSDKILIFAYFMITIILGAAALSLPGMWTGDQPLRPLDALFTSTSAVCVTGLIVVDTAEFSRAGHVVLMALIQLGGLGIVAFATIFVATQRKKVSLLNRGMLQEMYIGEVETNPRRILFAILASTLAVEALGFIALYLRFRSLGLTAPAFTAAFHAISAFCNAGFSTFPDNLDRFVGDFFVNIAIIFLIVLGGLGFVVIQDMERFFWRKRRRLSYHSKIVLATTGVLIVIGAAAFYLLEYDGAYASMDWPGKLLAALFQSVSPRTAGFDTVPQGLLGLPSLAVVILLMFTGGSPGSTAGGVKTTTLFMAIAGIFRGAEDDGALMYKGGTLPSSLVSRAFGVMAKALALVSLSFFLLLVFESARGHADYANLLFESVSAFGTVGLSRGVTASLSDAGKAVIIGTMFAGRVGLFAMSLPRSADRIERFADYPRENLMLG